MQRGYTDTPEGQIHYYVHGRGDPLLLLHQTPRSARAYAPLMQLLGKRFRCYAVDTLGFGNSDPLPPKATMGTLALSMTHFLDAHGIARVDVMGFHTGNKVAAALAAGFPDRVGKAVIAGMTHSLVVSRKARDAAILNIVKGYMAEYGESPDGSHRLRGWAADYASLAAIWWSPALLAQRRITDEALRVQESRMIEMIAARHSLKQIYSMNFDFDLGAALRRVKAPTLVIECCMPEEAHLGVQGPAVMKLLKNGRLVTLKGAGFEAPEDNARDFARHVTEFLRGK